MAILGTPGNDVTLQGTAGDDVVRLFGGDDYFFADNGSDEVSGGGGSDTVLDGAGTDTVFGGTGDDVLGNWLESAGDDSFFGDGGDDRIAGGPGNDLLDGGDGTDSMAGGSGNDSYVVAGSPDEVEEYGGGDDRVLLSETAFADGWTVFRLGADLVIEVEGQRVATLVGHFNPFGNDAEIETLAFNDGAEIDLLARSYVTYGTAGDDNAIVGVNVGGLSDDTIYGGAGNDRIFGYGFNPAVDSNNLLYGDSGRDSMTGGDFDDTLYGGDDKDRLFGRFGADLLDGGTGSNKLYGGYGDDAYVVGVGRDVIKDDRGADELQFVGLTTLEDLDFSRQNNNLRIQVNGETVVVVKGQYYGNFPGDLTVESIVFADGSTFDLTELIL